MNKIFTDTRSILLKAVCTVLVLILAGSLFSSGVIGADGCGMQCCCQTGSEHMQPSAAKQMRSPMGCCAETPLRSCDLQSAKPFELPEIVSASYAENRPNADGSTISLDDPIGSRQNLGGHFVAQVLDPKFNSPPLYLQNLSFLI